MTTKTRQYRICNGCGRDTFQHGIRIVESKPTIGWNDRVNTLDICEECAEVHDRYICRHCSGVHSDSDPCTKVAKMMAEETLRCGRELLGTDCREEL